LQNKFNKEVIYSIIPQVHFLHC